jgi:hypothetical protein
VYSGGCQKTQGNLDKIPTQRQTLKLLVINQLLLELNERDEIRTKQTKNKLCNKIIVLEFRGVIRCAREDNILLLNTWVFALR